MASERVVRALFRCVTTGEGSMRAALERAGEPERKAAPTGFTEERPIEDFLAAVGQRVRRQRTLVHMSRRQLAERSGVSERYLAQLETGQGNMSIGLLRRVARALELPLPELVAEDDAVSVSERLLATV